MLERWLAVGALVSSLLLLGLTSPPPKRIVEPAAPLQVAPMLPDTLRTDATAGTPLVLSLPSEIGDAPVARYTVLQGPSLCGVAGRSFTWITQGVAPDTHDVRLHAHHPDAQPDTLVVRIEITK